MDIDLNTLLVALMFVTILSMGIGNVLGSLADVVNHASPTRRSRVHVGWILFMLIVHFNLFWHTREILSVEDWQFADFLLVIAGPVLLFFATSILITEPQAGEVDASDRFFVRLGRRFFLMFAAVQGWVLVVDGALLGQVSSGDFFNAAMAALSLFLASTTAQRAQVLGIVAAWLLGVASLVLRGFGVIT